MEKRNKYLLWSLLGVSLLAVIFLGYVFMHTEKVTDAKGNVGYAYMYNRTSVTQIKAPIKVPAINPCLVCIQQGSSCWDGKCVDFGECVSLCINSGKDNLTCLNNCNVNK